MISEKDFNFLKFDFINEHIGLVEINSPPDNSLTLPVMDELIRIHNALEKEKKIRGVVLTSSFPGYFSNGLNVDDLLNADKNEKIKIFEALYDLSHCLYGFSKVHVSLLNGHAMAGGAIIAAMSDFRFIVDSPYRVSFSEVKLGIIVPEVFMNIISDIIGPQNLNTAILQAKAYKPAEALESHLVHGIYDEKEGLKKSISFLKNLLSSPPESLGETKHLLRKKRLSDFENLREETIKYFSNFFNENFQEALLAIKESRRPRFIDL